MADVRTVDVQTFLNEHPFSGYQWTIFALCFFIVLLDGFDTAAIGYIAPSLITEWSVERPALAPVLSAALFGLAFGALSAGPLADRFGRKAVLVASGADLRGCLFSVRVLGQPDSIGHLALHHRPRAWRGHAQRRHPHERVLPRWTARNADQRHVLRLSARRGLRRLSGGLDDSAVRLAQRLDARRDRAAGVGGAALPAAAGVGALHGGRKLSRGAHPQCAAPHLRDGCRCGVFR